jgi:ABC-type glutathione transport system ATPase component
VRILTWGRRPAEQPAEDQDDSGPARGEPDAPVSARLDRSAPDMAAARAASDARQEPIGEGWLTADMVQKTYKRRMVVKGVSLSVQRGESVGLLGPNGAGKTTCFYMITGLVPVDSGSVYVDGNDVTRLPMYRRARLGIGYLPQEQSIFRGLTVEQNIMAVLELVEPKKARRQEQLDALLEEFRITRLRKSPSIALSGGERLVHAARRAVRRHRPDRGRRHPATGAPPHGARHRRSDHRSQRPRDA